MDQTQVLTLMQNAVMTTLKVAAPLLIVALAVGLVVSILQATTQINEQTLSFAPKFVAILLTLLLLGGWMMANLESFFDSAFQYVDRFVR